MKQRTLLNGCLLAAAALVPTALADQIDIGNPSFGYGRWQTGNGGEFTFTPVNPSGWVNNSAYGTGAKNIDVAGSFQSFCIEGGEFIAPFPQDPPPYNAALNHNAVWGGVGPAGDPISVGTGWLYSQFARGVWSSGLSYDYTNTGVGRNVSADALQKAIWWLEGEESLSYDSGNIYEAAVVAFFGSEAEAKADGGWLYGVWALNLTNPTTGARAQDGLIYVPDGGTTLMLLGMATSGLAVVARRRKE